MSPTAKRRATTAASAIVLGAFALLAGCTTEGPPPPPNVVLILVDTLRPDHLGAYGYEPSVTPHIDRLAEQALVFENAYATGTWTVPSTASLFTSTLPTVHRVVRPPDDDTSFVETLHDEYLLFNEVLQEEGYRTGMITTIGWVSETANYAQGAEVALQSRRGDDDLVELAAEFLATPDRRPFHLYLHLIDLHDYFHPSKLFRTADTSELELSPEFLDLRRSTNTEAYRRLGSELSSVEALGADGLALLRQSYDRLLEETDRNIGRIVEALEDEGLLENTLVVLVSDHGEQFLEHGRLMHGGDGFYNEVLKIPFLVSAPQRFEVQQRIQTPVTLTDVVPTIFELLGIASSDLYQGRSVLAEPESDREVFATDGTIWKAITREWSYIVSTDGEREELFHLTSDPGEQINLAESEEHREVRDRLRRAIRTSRDTSREHPYLEIVPNPGTSELSEEELDALRALGYID